MIRAASPTHEHRQPQYSKHEKNVQVHFMSPTYAKLRDMTEPHNHAQDGAFEFGLDDVEHQVREIHQVPAAEVIATTAVHLMTAAAVKVGLGDMPNARDHIDLDEARTIITALAGLIVAGAPDMGSAHAAPLRDGLRTLQLAFRDESIVPDPPGQGPGEKYTGPVN